MKLRKSIAAVPDAIAEAKLEELESQHTYVSPVEVVKRPAVTSMVMKQVSHSCTYIQLYYSTTQPMLLILGNSGGGKSKDIAACLTREVTAI